MSQERADIQGAKDPPAGPQPGRIRTLNRARILQAAEEVFAEQGYRGATTAAIAGRAGLPKANLLEGVLDLWLAELDAITADQNPGEALTRYIHAKVMYSKTRPHASRVFANEVIRGARAIKGFLGADLVERIAEKSAVLEAWAAAGKMDPVDPVHLFSIIWAASQHYADFEAQVTALKGREKLSDKDYQAAAETITRFVLRGCGIGG
jgi:TetR/AcrR family transcriptional regulator